MNFKKIVSVLLAGVMATTALVVSTVSASAAAPADVVYLDNYEVKTVKSGVGVTFSKETQHWSRFTITSDTTVTFQKYRKDGSVAPGYAGRWAYLYKLSDSTTTKKFIEELDKYELSDGITRKLTRGSYAVYWNVGTEDDLQYSVTWSEKASDSSEVTALKVYIPLEVGDRMTLSSVVSPKKSKVTYSSSDKSVLTVSSKGLLKAIDEGTACITIKAGKKSVKLYFEVMG